MADAGYESRKLARELNGVTGGDCTSPNAGGAPSRWWA